MKTSLQMTKNSQFPIRGIPVGNPPLLGHGKWKVISTGISIWGVGPPAFNFPAENTPISIYRAPRLKKIRLRRAISTNFQFTSGGRGDRPPPQ